MQDAELVAQPELRPPLVERASEIVAVVGGLISLGVAVLVVISVLGRKFYNSPVNGDFEMVQIGTAIAVFSFLPYCQARRGNIVVDTFTSWLPARANTIIDAFWDLVYAGMMGLVAACLMNGAFEHFRSGQTTMLLQLIVWPALAVCSLLSAFLMCVALMTSVQRLRGRMQ
jgi:TRAP-type C4-dicarboxylate transport system permease small subunit